MAEYIDRKAAISAIRAFKGYFQDSRATENLMLKMEAEAVIADCDSEDVFKLPEGRPGDYLEWDNGTGFRQFYAIDSIMICQDCVRYELANMAPVVNHKNIVRILKEPEMKKVLEEKWAKEEAEEQPTYFSAPVTSATLVGGGDNA